MSFQNQWDQTLALEKELGNKLSWRKIRDNLDVPQGVARGLLFASKNRETISGKTHPVGAETKIEKDFKSDSATVTTKSLDIRTLEDAIVAANIDTEMWTVDRYVINSWEVTMGAEKSGTGQPETYTNYQVKVWFKRKIKDFKEVALESLVDRLTASRFTPDSIHHKPKPNPKLLEISLVDHHFGMLSWHRETNEDYDLKIAERFYLDAVDDLIDKTKHFNIGKILFPIGSDFFHVNNAKFMTERGNNQMDTDSRLAKIFEAGEMSVVKAVERCRQVAPVKLFWIPGNHDPETSFYLARVLNAYYHNCTEVEVDSTPTPRKFEKFGSNLIGYTHGDEEKHINLPNIMADAVPQWWADTTYREWHLGHLHKKKQMNFLSLDTYPGVKIRTLPSLSATDAWHYKKGYTGRDYAAESFIYDEMDGLVGQFTTYVKR